MKKFYFVGLIGLVAIIFISGCPWPPPACAEDWRCTEWSDCIDGQQTRVCTDINSCGTDMNKPAEMQGCTADLCLDVLCPNKCDGTTLMKDGRCVDGECTYTATENSAECGYVEARVEFETILRFCEYSRSNHQYQMFFTIKTIGEKNPEPTATIWLVMDNPAYSKPFFTIQDEYGKNDVLWQTLMWSGIPYKGRIWTVRDVPEFGDLNYNLIYCELEDPYSEECSASSGIGLYDGNTSTDCNELA